MKIINNSLANIEVALRTGVVLFDGEGMANIEPDEFAEELLQVPGFYRVVDIDSKYPEEILEGEKAEEVPEEPKGKDIKDMTGKELDQLAEELGMPDYPKTATVTVRRAAIGDFMAKN